MKVINLRCNNCGSNLKIQENIKFFTCTHCNSSLAIQESENVVYTEILDEIKGHTENLVTTSEKILIEQEIERLDRDWEKEKDQYLIHTDKGSRLPEKSSFLPFLIFVVIFAGAGIIGSSSHGSEEPGFIFGGMAVLTLIMGIYTTHIGNAQFQRFQQAQTRYTQRRSRLLLKLKQLR